MSHPTNDNDEPAIEDNFSVDEAGDTVPEEGIISGSSLLKDEDLESGGPSKRKARLSHVSSNYDVGNKGFLDSTEKVLRSYDANNDGNIDMQELKTMIRDLKSHKKDKTVFKKVAYIAIAAVGVLLVGNFGLVWAT